MKRFSVRLIVAVLTFLIGISAALLWFSRRNEFPNSQPVRNVEPLTAAPDIPDPCSFTKKVLNAPLLAAGMAEPSWERVRCPRTR